MKNNKNLSLSVAMNAHIIYTSFNESLLKFKQDIPGKECHKPINTK